MKISVYLLSLLFLYSCAQQKNDDEMVGTRATTNDSTQKLNDPTTDPNDPSQGDREQSFGFYSHGRLAAATRLPDSGGGFVKILRPRNRRFASEDMIYLITKVSKELDQKFPNRRDAVQIGDVSAELGGLVPGHNSHQNGLDVDIAFLRTNETMQNPDDVNGFREKFVSSGKVSNNFDLERNWALAKLMVATGRPQRIFVNQVIKNAFCKLAREKGELQSAAETLHRLRPYSGHEDHFHVRITCPLNSPKCEAQEEIPAGTGC